MHPADCGCHDCASATPLTIEEVGKLATFLVERGHVKTAYDLVGQVAYTVVTAEIGKAA